LCLSVSRVSSLKCLNSSDKIKEKQDETGQTEKRKS
jgi:hypothetical protein